MGRAENSIRQGFAIQRAQRTERFTRALSIAIPVLAYIWMGSCRTCPIHAASVAVSPQPTSPDEEKRLLAGAHAESASGGSAGTLQSSLHRAASSFPSARSQRFQEKA